LCVNQNIDLLSGKHMLENSLTLNLPVPGVVDNVTSQLRQNYLVYQKLFQAQPTLEQQYLKDQATGLADAIVNGTGPMHFSLPEHIVCLPMMDCAGMDERIPARTREYRVGNLLDRFTHPDMALALGQRLLELERSASQAVSAAAGLLRYAVAMQMIQQLVPDGKSVVYAVTEDDDIPNQPVYRKAKASQDIATPAESKFTEKGSADFEGSGSNASYSLNFFMPQLVALDDQNHLLVADLEEAISHVKKLRWYLCVLNSAVGLAPYIVVDEAYQTKRYGILGQLVNQGRALAGYEVDNICQTVKQRSASHRLDRGFSLSLPFFNDKTLAVEHYNFDVIPKGRVMFVPAFVVLAVRTEAARVTENTRLNRTTRRSLLLELYTLEKAFLR
jgi:hypothetical protein